MLPKQFQQPNSHQYQIPSLFLKPGSWVRVYSNQKEIEYISAHSSRAALKPPIQWYNLLYFSGKMVSKS